MYWLPISSEREKQSLWWMFNTSTFRICDTDVFALPFWSQPNKKALEEMQTSVFRCKVWSAFGIQWIHRHNEDVLRVLSYCDLLAINGWRCKHMDALNWNCKYAKMRFTKRISCIWCCITLFPTKSYQHKGIYKNSRDLYTILIIPIQSDWPYHFSRPSTYVLTGGPHNVFRPKTYALRLGVLQVWKNIGLSLPSSASRLGIFAEVFV